MKKTRLVKVLIALTVVLSIAIIGVSAQLISLKKDKENLENIINNPNEVPENPDPTPEPTPEPKPKPEPPINEEVIVPSTYISKDQATAIALNRVGSGSVLVEIESDLDDNPPKYEVEVILGDFTYELEIHAITGAIIDFEQDERD